MQDDIFLLVGLGTALLVSLLSTYFLYRKFPYLNFLEWFGTVFLLIGWYSLFIPSTMEFVIPGKWVNGTQLAGFIAADLMPPVFLFWMLTKRRKAHQSKQSTATAPS
jgi:hypothetical protein